MNKTTRYIVLLFFSLTILSCENVFHNDRLDFMWRLDSVEFVDGKDFEGNSCDIVYTSGVRFSFARDLLEVESDKRYLRTFGVLTDNGNCLSFDFSMCVETNIDDELRLIGIGSRKTVFEVTLLDGNNLILTGDKTILRFTRW